MKYKYHLFQCDVGWIALVGTNKGLRRLSLKPTPQEALDDLGADLDQSVNDPSSFTEVEQCIKRYLQ